jgi:hypothetical protein
MLRSRVELSPPRCGPARRGTDGSQTHRWREMDSNHRFRCVSGTQSGTARGYDEKEIFRVEHLWDTRNLIVHSRGIVDVAYTKKYKHLQKGVHVKVNLAQLHWWLPALKGFIECTDQFFLNYRPSPMNKEPV